jgi:Putative prokaryotic signal transducing protein
MATSWCPQCRTEYREGTTVCADCGATLVAELPAPKPEHRHNIDEALGTDVPIVEVTRVSATEAEMVAAQLRGAGIRAAVLGVGTAGELSVIQYTYGSRVMVRSDDLEAAQRLLADLFDGAEPGTPIDDETLGALAEAATEYADPETGAIV